MYHEKIYKILVAEQTQTLFYDFITVLAQHTIIIL